MSSVDFNILNIGTLLQERRLSKTTASFLSTEHDLVMLRQISTMEIDLSEDDDCNIQGQLNDERLSMMTISSWSISNTKHDREPMDNIPRELSEKRVPAITADFLTTEHDPKILRQISTMEVDIGLDDSLHCPGLDISNVSRVGLDENDEYDNDSDGYDSDGIECDDDWSIGSIKPNHVEYDSDKYKVMCDKKDQYDSDECEVVCEKSYPKKVLTNTRLPARERINMILMNTSVFVRRMIPKSRSK